jgi:prepilin-type N-terminal cleavage/methylation domain-containing protein
MKNVLKLGSQRTGFTLVEVLIVVVIMAILAATIIPQFTDSTKDAKASTSRFNLHTLRSQIELYRTQHNGTAPTATLVELTQSTNAAGLAGTGSLFPYGPYIREIPKNPFTNDDDVKPVSTNPPVVGDVTSGGGGWLYHAATGGIWIDHPDYWQD